MGLQHLSPERRKEIASLGGKKKHPNKGFGADRERARRAGQNIPVTDASRKHVVKVSVS